MADEMVIDGHLGGYLRGGDHRTWCPALWSWVVTRFRIRSVLDVGCGEGHSTKFFHELGCTTLGVDGCQTAIHDSVIPGQVRLHDFCEGAYIIENQVDMIWACEFLEHIEEKFLPNILDTFSQATKLLLITHAFPGQGGHHHVNCRPTSYWIRQIEKVGFVCAVDSTRKARTQTLRDNFRLNHFARSGVAFVHRSLIEEFPADLSKSKWSPGLKSFWINTGFQWSSAFWSHRWRRHAWKRQRAKVAG